MLAVCMTSPNVPLADNGGGGVVITLKRILAFTVCLLSCTVVGCSGKKGTEPTGTGIQGSWPADAVGQYERTREYQFCPGNPLGCHYDLEHTDTVEVCGDPTENFITEFIEGYDFPTREISGHISDSLYFVYVRYPTTRNCYMYLTMSTERTNQPPSRDGWQFTVVFDTDCGEWYPGMFRYTYTRIGDGDCLAEGE